MRGRLHVAQFEKYSEQVARSVDSSRSRLSKSLAISLLSSPSDGARTTPLCSTIMASEAQPFTPEQCSWLQETFGRSSLQPPTDAPVTSDNASQAPLPTSGAGLDSGKLSLQFGGERVSTVAGVNWLVGAPARGPQSIVWHLWIITRLGARGMARAVRGAPARRHSHEPLARARHGQPAASVGEAARIYTPYVLCVTAIQAGTTRPWGSLYM